jgi:hypothetical protein
VTKPLSQKSAFSCLRTNLHLQNTRQEFDSFNRLVWYEDVLVFG